MLLVSQVLPVFIFTFPPTNYVASNLLVDMLLYHICVAPLPYHETCTISLFICQLPILCCTSFFLCLFSTCIFSVNIFFSCLSNFYLFFILGSAMECKLYSLTDHVTKILWMYIMKFAALKNLFNQKGNTDAIYHVCESKRLHTVVEGMLHWFYHEQHKCLI